MIRRLLFGFFIFLAPLTIGAVEGSEKEVFKQFQASFVERLATAIQADDVSAMAWSAHFAGRHGFVDAVPLLRTLLAREPQTGDVKRKYLVLAVIDALVRLDARVSDEELNHATAYHCREAAIALAARTPGQHQEFLRRQLDYQYLGDECWTAVCNLLSAENSPLLAEPLMRSMVTQLEIRVQDQGSSLSFGGNMRFLSRIGCGRGTTAPEGFPPTAGYTLVDSPKSGDVMVAPGSRAIYLRRIESSGSNSVDHPEDRNEAIPQYLAVLLKRSSPLLAKVEHKVTWSTAEAYLSEVASARKAMEDAWRTQTAELQAKKLLPETVSLGGAQITVTVFDERSDDSKPLPPIEGVIIDKRG